MMAKNEFKVNLRITKDNLNKITLPIIALDMPLIRRYAQSNYNER